MRRASEPKLYGEKKDSNERGEGSTGHGDYFIVVEFLFRSLDIFLTLYLFFVFFFCSF
jgi:hypothetical protein